MNIKNFRSVGEFGWRAAAAVVVAGMLLGCGEQPEAVAPTPPEVTVSTPTQRDVTIVHEFVGTTQARESVEIRARGLIKSGHFRKSRLQAVSPPLAQVIPLTATGWVCTTNVASNTL